MRPLPAIIASLAITAVIALGIFVIGINAVLNPNTVPVVNAASNSDPGGSIATVSNPSSSSVSANPAADQQIAQLQSLIKQYQDREQQYQTQLSNAAQQLDQANQQLQSYQQLLTALEQRGIIRIDQNGNVLIPRSRSSFDEP
jgi:septal ring factor EnvC (AmiA/AmiB activator)